MTPRAPLEIPEDQRRPRPQLERNASTISKLSLPTSSQSNEADDEQSFSDSFDMESSLSPPNYEGEDTRLTSDKELSGFYMYGWAAEVSFCKLYSCFTCRSFLGNCMLYVFVYMGSLSTKHYHSTSGCLANALRSL